MAADQPRTYLKAIVGGVGTALAVAVTAATDNSISLQEGIYIVAALVGGFQTVYWAPNKP